MKYLIAATGTEMSPWKLTRTLWTGGVPDVGKTGKEVPVHTLAERVLSWMGWLLNKRRLSMSGETLSMQLFLKDM